MFAEFTSIARRTAGVVAVTSLLTLTGCIAVSPYYYDDDGYYYCHRGHCHDYD